MRLRNLQMVSMIYVQVIYLYHYHKIILLKDTLIRNKTCTVQKIVAAEGA